MAGGESIELQRERVVQALCAHFARDALTVDDLDARLEHAQSARSLMELQALVSDLPAIDAKTPVPERMFALAAPSEGSAVERVASIFGEVKRKGAWTVPERIDARVVCGSVVLDLTQAKLQPELTTIDASVWFGELKVIVPPGVRVESHGGTALFGAFDHKETPSDALPAHAPVVRITGVAAFGAVTIRTRMPRIKGSAKAWLQNLLGE